MQQPEAVAAPPAPPADPPPPSRSPPGPVPQDPVPQDPAEERGKELLEDRERLAPLEEQEEEEEDFSFLRCAACGAEPKAPKLLGCLHSLCTGCMGVGSGCPACGDSGAGGTVDNVFFESLQRQLAVHRLVVGAQASCSRCQAPAAVWCPECQQLLCCACSQAHGWFLKHEVQPLDELRAQSVHAFLDSTRTAGAIFCANPKHRVPTLTSIYCRGCDKPLCCACALLDRAHAEQQCDLGEEVRRRREELRGAVHALREQEAAFREARAQAREAEARLERARAEAEAEIRARARRVQEHVRARERALLAAVAARFEREHAALGARLRGLDAALRRLRGGTALGARAGRLAADAELLAMHAFLRAALARLRCPPPPAAAGPRPDCFAEFRVPLRDLVAGLGRARQGPGGDAALPVSASPQPAHTPGCSSETESPEAVKGQEARTLVLAAVRPEPDVHPVPTLAFSIKALPCPEQEHRPAAPLLKRKSCQTECPQKLVKLEAALRTDSSQTSSPPALDRPSSPESPQTQVSFDLVGEDLLHNSSPAPEDLSEPGETEDRVVVLSSSEEDSGAEMLPCPEPESGSEESDLQLEGPCPLWGPEDSLCSTEDGPLVFFDLKIDTETQTLSQLAAVGPDAEFRVLLGARGEAVSLDAGLRAFLAFLRARPRPVLACRRLWGRALPPLFHALEAAGLLAGFTEAVSGLLAVLPLLHQRVPAAPSPRLRTLTRTYLARELGGGAMAGALALRDLCRLLDVGAGFRPHVHAVGCLRCFAGLQPLVRSAVLTRGHARLLALHNVDLAELRDAHRRDPRAGLLRYSRYLEELGQPGPGLSALAAFLEGLPACSQS